MALLNGKQLPQAPGSFFKDRLMCIVIWLVFKAGKYGKEFYVDNHIIAFIEEA
jgi:hypothetical protein